MASTSRRNFLALSTLALAGSSVTGCSIVGGAGDALTDSGSDSTETVAPLDKSRTLVAYFSVPETDDPDGMTEDESNSSHVVDGKVLGNTQYVAQIIGERTGSEVFRIETAEELPLDHDTLEDLALKQQETDERPKLKALIPNLDSYDTVFIGYPIWWYDLPMPMYTFLEEHDFSGKTVILFNTHGGSRLSETVETITDALSDATVIGNALTISRDDMDSAEGAVTDWLDSLGQ
ncbi:flavodoxin [Streptomyces phaeochromogenes]|uniref:Flavodoxin n=1 Tax=Streptomyces phaeochromogenes TaxID=1923 RepID=A0ABZ1H875_STRPH|nr:flavodoxin [Streptomyces phaeochromogenes]WSD14334.1 flavodoxin [Streptomyces phaeochromogenes]